MVQQTRWFEIGEPVENDRVEATIRTTYQTGPNTSGRSDDVEHGTIDIDVVGMMEDAPIAEHVHEDGSVLLSALDSEAEVQLLGSFKQSPIDRIEQHIRDGCSPAEAVDYEMTEERGLSQTIWSERRGRTQQAIADNVRKAREKLEG